MGGSDLGQPDPPDLAYYPGPVSYPEKPDPKQFPISKDPNFEFFLVFTQLLYSAAKF